HFTISGASAPITLFTGTGADTVSVLETGAALQITNRGGQDRVVLGSQAPDPNAGFTPGRGTLGHIAGAVNIFSQSGGIDLTVDDSAGSQARQVSLSTLVTGGSPTQITGLGPTI